MTDKVTLRPRKTLSPEHIAAIKRANTGKVVSAATRARMSESAKRRPKASPETRAKMSKNNGARKPVKFRDIEFHSQAECARFWGVAETTMSKWIREGLDDFPDRKQGSPGRPLKRKRKAR